jgi:hypothetical protein
VGPTRCDRASSPASVRVSPRAAVRKWTWGIARWSCTTWQPGNTATWKRGIDGGGGGAQSRAGRAGASRASEPILARGSSSNCNVEWRQTWKRVLPIGTCQLPRDRATSRFLTVSKFQRHAAAHAVAQLNRRMATWRDDGIEHAARSLISGQPARHIWPTSADQDCFFQS